MSQVDLKAVAAELEALRGARLQRVDRTDPHTWTFELRVPGRTYRLLVRVGPGRRFHLVDSRPPRTEDGGDEQRRLRKRLVGQPLVDLEFEGHHLRLAFQGYDLAFDLGGGRRALSLNPVPSREVPSAAEPPPRFAANALAAESLTESADRGRSERLRQEGLRLVRSRLKKQKRLVGKIRGDVARLERMLDDLARGELLKSNLKAVERGADHVEVRDWSTGDSVRIPLRPDLGPTENLERLFARGKRGRRGLTIAGARLEAARARLAELGGLRDRLEGGDLANLDEIRSLTQEAGLVETSSEVRKRPVDRWARRFRASDGTEIWVGRGAKENDRLTLSAARAYDRWLHARGVTGAHVIVKCLPNTEPSPEAVLDGAHLAIQYSAAKNEPRADVIVTEVRNVKKTKGAPAGQVGVAKSRTLHVVVEPARLERLLSDRS